MKKYGLFDDIYTLKYDEEGEVENHLYELLSEHGEGLNEFLGRVSEKFNTNWLKEPYDEKKDLEITLNYLEPLLKEGKIEVNINKLFNSKSKMKSFLSNIKTEGVRKKMIDNLENHNKISIYYDYGIKEIETFKDDIYNILFNFCETNEERGLFENNHIIFSLPKGEGLYK